MKGDARQLYLDLFPEENKKPLTKQTTKLRENVFFDRKAINDLHSFAYNIRSTLIDCIIQDDLVDIDIGSDVLRGSEQRWIRNERDDNNVVYNASNCVFPWLD